MHWKAKGRLAGYAVLLASFVSANAPSLAGPVVASDAGVLRVSQQTDMRIAETVARDQFEAFVAHVLDERLGKEAAIKVADKGKTLWITDISRQGSSFAGRTPSAERLTFSADQVRDWSFIGTDGKLYGSFSTRALLGHLPGAQAKQVSAVLSVTPTAWPTTKIAGTENFPLQAAGGTNR